jgi:hypothetical protein
MIPLFVLVALFASACARQQTDQTGATPGASPTEEAAVSPTADAKDYLFEFALTGAAEKPGPGDEDGAGTAKINPEEDSICFDLEARNIDKPDKAHIHEGAVSVAGPIAFDLRVPGENQTAPPWRVSGCTGADASLVSKIKSQPQNYYVNIHNAAFPNGAVRGQLSSAATSSPASSPAPGGGAPGY